MNFEKSCEKINKIVIFLSQPATSNRTFKEECMCMHTKHHQLFLKSIWGVHELPVFCPWLVGWELIWQSKNILLNVCESSRLPLLHDFFPWRRPKCLRKLIKLQYKSRTRWSSLWNGWSHPFIRDPLHTDLFSLKSTCSAGASHHHEQRTERKKVSSFWAGLCSNYVSEVWVSCYQSSAQRKVNLI